MTRKYMRVDNGNERRASSLRLQFRDRDRGPALCTKLGISTCASRLCRIRQEDLTIARCITHAGAVTVSIPRELDFDLISVTTGSRGGERSAIAVQRTHYCASFYRRR